ncbi:MAG: hypothetical protein PGN29_07420 [Gordonia paraffinivorans]
MSIGAASCASGIRVGVHTARISDPATTIDPSTMYAWLIGCRNASRAPEEMVSATGPGILCRTWSATADASASDLPMRSVMVSI